MKIAIFGGTFDPPHHGHITLAAEAVRQLGLDKVLWVVTAEPPHKRGQVHTHVGTRLALVEAAISGNPAFEVSRVDIDRPGPHWAADTVALVSWEYPQAELYYLMGGDSLRDLPTWGRPHELLACCQLGVMRRPGDAVDLGALEPILPGISSKVAFIEVPAIPISSQDIRRKVQAGEPIDGLLPDSVATLVRDWELYR
jgi:nicotinate-nucleotide adenylyltransferase